MKIVTVVGARPQFIKAAAISRLAGAGTDFEEVLVHTGQHYDPQLSDVFFAELGLPAPAYRLGVGSGSHGTQTGRMLEAIERVLLETRPDWVLVYGDTNSTLAGALAAAKLHLPVAHVEAGLRSRLDQPEELNRVLTDHASALLLAPTREALRNLRREGLSAERAELVGDVMLDVARIFGEKAERESGVLERLGLSAESYVLATLHRAENTDDPARLRAIVEGLARLARETRVVLPLHPRTRKAIAALGVPPAGIERLEIVDPQGYLDMLRLERHARLIATDSGGVQKEAFFYRVPCLTLREATEWTELVSAGWNRLVVPSDAAAVYAAAHEALTSPPGSDTNPYGDGHSAERIIRLLKERARPHAA